MTATNIPPFPAVADVLFALKTFAAAMLALLVAQCFDLQNPYWALTTVYVVSTPLSGASTSKALYRLLGTAIGAAMTVVLVPNLVNSPEILTAAICLWIGVCLAVSLLDRTPRSYVFMLAGYTTALTSFPIVDAPDTAFTYVMARVLEIAVGILCAAVVNRLIFPRHVGPVLAARIDRWLTDGSALIAGMLETTNAAPQPSAQILRLAADAVDLRGFTTHLAYDTSSRRDVVGLARTLQRRMVIILPMASALSDALAILARATNGDFTTTIQTLLDETSAWLGSGEALSPEKRSTFLELIGRAERETASMPQNNQLLMHYLTARLKDVILIWSDCLDLKKDILSGSRHELSWQRFGILPKDWPMHKDYGMALHSGLSAMLATGIASAVWMLTGWAQGGVAAMMAAVLCCIFSTLDDPAPAMRGFLVAAAMSILAAFCLDFGVLPALHGFIPLVAALGLVLIPSALLMTRPKTAIAGLGFSMLLPTLMSLAGRLDLDLTTFANSNLAILGGFAIAVVTTAVVRSVGAEWSASRLQRASWTDIATSARKRHNVQTHLSHRVVDRLGLIAPRLAALADASRHVQDDVVHDLRNSLNIAELQRSKELLGREDALSVDVVLRSIAAHYQKKRLASDNGPDTNLQIAIDQALRRVGDGTTMADDSAKIALTGLRYSLFPDNAIFAANESQPHETAQLRDKVA